MCVRVCVCVCGQACTVYHMPVLSLCCRLPNGDWQHDARVLTCLCRGSKVMYRRSEWWYSLSCFMLAEATQLVLSHDKQQRKGIVWSIKDIFMVLHILDTLCKCVSIHVCGFELASKRNLSVNAVYVGPKDTEVSAAAPPDYKLDPWNNPQQSNQSEFVLCSRPSSQCVLALQVFKRVKVGTLPQNILAHPRAHWRKTTNQNGANVS